MFKNYGKFSKIHEIYHNIYQYINDTADYEISDNISSLRKISHNKK